MHDVELLEALQQLWRQVRGGADAAGPVVEPSGCLARDLHEVLEALRSYEGAVVLVSHDPGAVHALGPERVLILPDGDEDLWNDDYADLVELA